MASAGKKTKKKKKTTISINGPPVFTSSAPLLESWADQSEIELIESIRNVDPGINLPKAPRSTRECEFDASHVPLSPPFQAHLTNIPFDITEDEIIDCFSRFNVINCTLPKDVRTNRLKGFGYIEFSDREELIEALCIAEMTVKGRRMKIDLPGKDQDRFRDRGGRDMHRQGNNRADGDPEDPDRTFSDWRNAPRAATSDRDSDRSGYRKDDRSFKRSGFGDRDSERPKEIDDDSCWRDGNREVPVRENTDGGNRWRERDRSGGFEKRGEGFEKRGEGFEKRDGFRGDRNGFDRGRDRDRDRNRDDREREGSSDDWRADKGGEGGERNSRAFDRRDRDSGFGRRNRDRDSGFEKRGRDGFREGGYGRRDGDDGFERRDREREGFDKKGEPDRSERGWRDEPRVIPTPLPNTREVSSRDSRNSGPRDSSYRDSGPRDSSYRDSGPRDSGPRDSGPRDSGPRDSGPRDSGSRDSGPRESGPRDSDLKESGNRDAGSRDASVSPVREKKDEPPATRKPLNLKPRTAPLTSRDPETTQSSVFGSAKPVDTAAKERELEEKWNKERHVPSKGGHDKDKDKDKEKDKDKDKDKDHRKDKNSDSRPSKENEPPKEVNKILEPAPLPKENAWTKRRTQQTSNNGHLESEEAKTVEKVDLEPKERNEEIVATTESKPKPVDAAAKETFKPKSKDISSNDVKTSTQPPVNDSKKNDDRPVSSRTPPKVNDKPVKPQSQEQPADEDSEWSTKVSRIEIVDEIQSKIPKAKEQKPPNFAGVNKYALFEDPEDINKSN